MPAGPTRSICWRVWRDRRILDTTVAHARSTPSATVVSGRADGDGHPGGSDRQERTTLLDIRWPAVRRRPAYIKAADGLPATLNSSGSSTSARRRRRLEGELRSTGACSPPMRSTPCSRRPRIPASSNALEN